MVVVVGAVACSTAPTADPPVPGTTTTTPGGITLPPRPRDIPVDGVEPCSLLTAEQRAALGLDGNPITSTGSTQIFGSARSCDVRGSDPLEVAVGITLVTTTGVERFTGGELAANLTTITVGGFPAVLARPVGLDSFCSVELDVARGQMIDVQFRDGGRKPPVPLDRLCRGAEQVAGEVMTSLLAR